MNACTPLQCNSVPNSAVGAGPAAPPRGPSPSTRDGEGRYPCSLSHVAAETDDGPRRGGLPSAAECCGQRRAAVERTRAVGPARGRVGDWLVPGLV